MGLELSVLASFTILWVAVVPSPGPNVLMVTHVAVTRTPAHVGFAILGNVSGMALLASLALLGWAAVLKAFPWLRLGVSLFGGFYLIWLGCKLIHRAGQNPAAAASASALPAATGLADYRKTALLGLVTALSNAQAILFITSIYAATGILNTNLATGLASIAIMVSCNATYLAALGWLFQRQQVRAGYARFRHWLEAAIGALFIFFGGRMLWRVW